MSNLDITNWRERIRDIFSKALIDGVLTRSSLETIVKNERQLLIEWFEREVEEMKKPILLGLTGGSGLKDRKMDREKLNKHIDDLTYNDALEDMLKKLQQLKESQ